jgi:hypothetical protein
LITVAERMRSIDQTAENTQLVSSKISPDFECLEVRAFS